VLLILHGVTLLLGTFQLTLQFLLLVLTVALELGLLFGQLHFLVNHGGDHCDLMLLNRAISNFALQLVLLVFDFVNLNLVLLDGVSEVFGLDSQLVTDFLHLGALLLLLDQTLGELLNFLFVVLFLVVVESNHVILGVVLLLLLELCDTGGDRLNVVHQGGLQVLSTDSDSFALNLRHIHI